MRVSPCIHSVVLAACWLGGCGRLGFSFVTDERPTAPAQGEKSGEPAQNTGGSSAGGATAGDGTDAGLAFSDDGGPSNTGGGTGGAGSDGGTTSAGANTSGGTMGGSPACQVNVSSLAHRYAFAEASGIVLDSVGTAHGTIRGASLDGSGALTLDGSGDYVMLPGGLISGSSQTTIVMWVEWNSGTQHQVLFDVGATQQGVGTAGAPTSHVQLKVSTPQYGFTLTTQTPSVNDTLSVLDVIRVGALEQVAVVLNADRDTMTLYRNGKLLAERSAPGLSLSEIDDQDFWLGGTLDSSDNDFRGRLVEARVYSAALAPCHVEQLSVNGPDVTTLIPCGCP